MAKLPKPKCLQCNAVTPKFVLREGSLLTRDGRNFNCPECGALNPLTFSHEEPKSIQ